jgi:hypothetical protein
MISSLAFESKMKGSARSQKALVLEDVAHWEDE